MPVQSTETQAQAPAETGAAPGQVDAETLDATQGWSWWDWLALGIIAAAGAVGLWWSWGTWPDVIIDFGRELYVPWRLTEGDVLYRDIAYFHGPLSPYLNALWFRLFGASLLTLVVANVVIMAGVLWLLYLILKALAGRAAAVLAGLTFVTVFAYGALLPMGNFNWVCPYSHEATHASALSLLSIYLLYRYARRGGIRAAAGSGLALGLVFLTKAEFFLAAALAAGCGLIATLLLERPRWSVAARALGVWAALACLPAVGAFLSLSTMLPARQAMIGTLGSWAYAFDTKLTGNKFYISHMGLDDPWNNLREMAIRTGAYVLLLAAISGAALLFRRPGRRACLGAASLFALAGGAFGYFQSSIQWEGVAQPWPVFLLVLWLTTSLAIWRQRRAPRRRRILVLRLAMIMFSLALLLRMILNVWLLEYGFALAMPGTMILLAGAFAWLPAIVRRLGGQAVVYRGALLAVWLVAVAVHLIISNSHFRDRKFPVGSGADRFLADSRGPFVNAALELIAQHARPGHTMAVIPEGVMLNYLARMPAATPYLFFIPTAIQMHGEQRMLEAFRGSPPDWVVVMPRRVVEFGYQAFGSDYAQELAGWVVANYETLYTIGNPPFSQDNFGIFIAQPKARPGLP